MRVQFTHAGALGRPTSSVTKDEVLQTSVAGLFDRTFMPCRHEAGKNMLFCSTFPLVWEEVARVGGNTIMMQYDPPLYVGLQRDADYANDLDPASFIVGGGHVRDEVLPRLNHNLHRHFAGAAHPRLLPVDGLSPDHLFSYSYLWKQLSYDERPGVFAKVATETGGFVVDVPITSSEDRLIVASVPRLEALPDTVVLAANAALQPSQAPAAWTLQQLAVPRIHFDLVWKFRTTAGRYHFRLDQHGATLLSEAAQIAYSVPSMLVARDSSPLPRPLLVIMGRRHARRPYFVLWCENTELLMPDPG
jgi:hypothetical protein